MSLEIKEQNNLEIKENVYKIKCDFAGCKNIAKFYAKKKGMFKNSSLYFCENCLQELYSWYAGKTTPKSPGNILNKSKKSSIIKEYNNEK